jgi:hypothetical protein
VVVEAVGFFLQQIPVESPAAEEVLELGCLPEAESPQAVPAPLRPLAAAEAVGLLEELRAVEKRQPLPSGLLKLHRLQSRNTSAGVAGK